MPKTVEQNAAILHVPILDMDVSTEFKLMACVNNFKTLEDAIKHPLETFHELPQSSQRMLIELLRLLESNGLMDLARQ